MPKSNTFSEQIRQAIRDSGMTAYRIAKESGVHLAALMRFLDGKSLTLTSVDRLATVLRMRVTVDSDEDTPGTRQESEETRAPATARSTASKAQRRISAQNRRARGGKL